MNNQPDMNNPNQIETIIDHIQASIFLVNVCQDGTFRFEKINKVQENTTGLSNDFLKGKTPVEGFGTEKGRKIEANYRRCLEEERTISYEETLDLPAGKKTALTKLTPVRSEGRIVQIVGTSMDITAQKKKAERKLQERNQELSCIFKVTEIVRNSSLSIGEMLQEVARIIPQAFPHPELTSTRICYDGHCYKSENFQETPSTLSCDITFHGNKVGIFEVFLKKGLLEIDNKRQLIQELGKGLTRTIERIRTETQLSENEHKFRTLFETMAQGVVYQDKTGEITAANPAAERILGLSLDQLQGRTSTDPRWKAIHEDGSPFPGEEHPAMVALRTGQSVFGEIMGVYHPPEEQYHWIKVNAIPQYHKGEDEPYQVYTSFEDVTQEYEAKEKLQENKIRLELAMDAGEHGFTDHNLETDEVFYSPGYFKMLGYEPDELPMKKETWIQLLHPEDQKRVVPIMETYVNQGKSFTEELRLKCKDGTYKWISSRGKFYYYDKGGKPARVVSVHVDIDELKQKTDQNKLLMDIANTFINAPLNETDEIINESLAKLGEFTETDRSYIFMYDHERRVTNNTYEWCAEGIEPQIDELQEIPMDSIPEWVKIHFSGESMYIPNIAALPPESNVRQILEPQGVKSLLALPMMEEETCIGFVGFDAVRTQHQFTDKEQQLLELFSMMLVNLFNRNQTQSELTIAMENAKEGSKAKSEFLSTMSHELRTPLNGVIGFSEILKSTITDENQVSYLNVILSSANHLLEIISDILDLSKIEANRFELNPKKNNLRALIEKTVSVVRQKAEEKGLVLTTDIADNVPGIVKVDSGRLKQILLNLLSNAVKFTDEGGVYLTVTLLEEQNGKAKLLFKVADTGIGIKEKDQERILEPFQQLDMSSTRQYGGTGLGVTITKDLLQKMGSTLQIDSTLGKGSTFSFELILSCEEEKKKTDEVKNEEHDKSASFKGKTILVAEDDRVNMKFARTALSVFSKDIRIIEADNGEEAYRKYLKHRPDLILMDIVMPEIDGYQATGMIRQHDKHTPIVAMTAKALKADKEACLESGMDDYITKPVSLERLKGMLKQYLL